jgi:hypothetical protein
MLKFKQQIVSYSLKTLVFRSIPDGVNLAWCYQGGGVVSMKRSLGWSLVFYSLLFSCAGVLTACGGGGGGGSST